MSNERFNLEEEMPRITIESITDDSRQTRTETTIILGSQHRWRWIVGAAVAALAAVVVAFGCYKQWSYYYNIGVPISVSPKENIEKLKTMPLNDVAPGVTMLHDSILGVGLNIYALDGLRAEITMEEPDTADASVFLYSRCSDFTGEGKYLGSLVVNGESLSDDQTRLGYFAAVGNRMVIGVSRFEGVRDFCIDNEGAFFRQFILVSGGEIPSHFHLHGKVERRAIGRKLNDAGHEQLCYIEAPHPETMWDFADALREYGFIDAIYITGGNDYSFYRSADGTRRDIGSAEVYPHKKWKGITPWLVFRAL